MKAKLLYLLAIIALANISCAKEQSNDISQIAKEPKILTRSDIEKIFEEQVNTLVKKGYPTTASIPEATFVGMLRKAKNKITGLNLKEETEESIPFLIVIPNNLVSVDKQFVMAGITRNLKLVDDGGFGNQHLMVPKDIYVITDVQDGRGYVQGGEAMSCIKYFTENGRTGLTTEEGAALATHYPTHFGDHDIGLVGDLSFYGGEIGWFLLLNPGRLSTHETKQPHSSVGIASCSKNRL